MPDIDLDALHEEVLAAERVLNDAIMRARDARKYLQGIAEQLAEVLEDEE